MENLPGGTGLTEAQAKEFHKGFMRWFFICFGASMVAHFTVGTMIGGWSYWG